MAYPTSRSTSVRRWLVRGAPILLAAFALAAVVQRHRAGDDKPSTAPAAPATSSAAETSLAAPASSPPGKSPVAKSIGWVDTPAGESIVGPVARLTGWALDPEGIRSVEVRVAGRTFPARVGIARPDVAASKPGYPDSAAAGFEFVGDFASLLHASGAERHRIQVVALNRAGAEKLIATRSLLPAADTSEWRSLYARRGMQGSPPFSFLPGVSGVSIGGPHELDTTYRDYVSPTIRVGMRVPLLYMRTTRGAAHDFVFDANWDIEGRCGNKRIAEDSLNAVIAYARTHRLPVLFTLNGGVWGDATCDVPQWDLTDHLEQDRHNCQWNDRGEVMPDDHLEHLAGSTESPQLGRMLTFNVYAHANRRYKKRNLQAAARIVAAFAREHPELFAGVNLDPDTYHNPFYDEKQWYDYNPGTLRQFREWLAGTGPYAGRGGPGIPDLSAYRRTKPFTLADVNRLSGRNFPRWSDVDPPRVFPREGKPFWEDVWTHEWEVFRRHLVDLHYDELSQWLAEAGIVREVIFSSQGFMGPHPAAKPFAVRVSSPSKNYDTGGMSVEGSIPKHGHLGAIVYGPGAANDIRMEGPDSLFATFRRMDPGWAIVEFNTADLRHPTVLPSYDIAYRSLREAFNFGARFASPMAWNGSNGLAAGKPGYVSYTAWRNTPLEDAMRDFAVAHAYVPLGTRLWTFGTVDYAHDDGWGGDAGTGVAASRGRLEIRRSDGNAVLVSPDKLAIARDDVDLLVLGANTSALPARVHVEGQAADGRWLTLSAPREVTLSMLDPAGVLLPLTWPAGLAGVERVRIALTYAKDIAPLSLRHIALYPPARNVARTN